VSDDMKPAYLFHGTDDARMDQARARLRSRAEAGGGVASLEVFEAPEGRGTPDADALADAISSMSLIPTRRYLLADGIQKWGKRQQKAVSDALVSAPELTTVVLMSRGKVPGDLEAVVKSVGGDVTAFEALPLAKAPAKLVEMARQQGFELELDAAKLLVNHLGTKPKPEDGANMARLGNEIDRLALWAGPDGRVTLEDVEEMVVDTSEIKGFALGDALVAGERDQVILTAERLLAQGVTVGSMVYPAASSLRGAEKAMAKMEQGANPGQLERQLGMPPFLARRLIASLGGTSLETLKAATVAISDLEVWTRGGAEYPDALALDLALMAATDASL